jgi:hypothetical protein
MQSQNDKYIVIECNLYSVNDVCSDRMQIYSDMKYAG